MGGLGLEGGLMATFRNTYVLYLVITAACYGFIGPTFTVFGMTRLGLVSFVNSDTVKGRIFRLDV